MNELDKKKLDAWIESHVVRDELDDIDSDRDPIAFMLNAQLVAQRHYYGKRPDQLEGDELKDYVRTMALALHDEVTEAMNEVSWKPWAQDQDRLHKDAFQKELVDVLFFWLALWLITGDDVDEMSDELMAQFHHTVIKNAKRRRDGYTGAKRSDGRELDYTRSSCPACGDPDCKFPPECQDALGVYHEPEGQDCPACGRWMINQCFVCGTQPEE